MNKKVNTLLFILGATTFNILMTVISFIILILLYIKFLIPLMPEANRSWGFSIIFLASIVISFFVYRYVLKFLISKIDIEKYFDPIFVKKYKKH
ncbi:MAG: leader peptide processing enzyme [Treponema sp.]|nr:leader peptide processing enzyme [Treponema sp.]MCL2273053.1 leader peptide processing enzyme [Treponema sp.]